ncbi:MAG: OmpH family outer membrane protein [bacterium]|nr:OmpH family outer membrane protein [bacterium]
MNSIWKNEKRVEIMLAGLVLILGIVLLISEVLKPSIKIASVDMNRIVNEHPAMEEAVKTFHKELSNLQKTVDKMNEKEKIKQQQRIQQEISQIAIRLQNEAMAKITKDIENLAKKQGYSYVVDKGAVIVGGKDITEDILNAIRKNKTEEKKAEVPDMPMIPVK